MSTMTVTVYGIKNCDTVKRTRKWMESRGIDYHFHYVLQDVLGRKMLADWIRKLGYETLLNRRGTTWRKLPEADRNNVDEARAMELMLEHPALIKRPVLDVGGQYHVGFDEPTYRHLLK